MNREIITTSIVIICLLIIGLYVMGEVNYFSSKIAIERNIESPVILIPSIGVEEKINNETLSQGVWYNKTSNIPTEGDLVIYGHRTLQGSPFLRLNELSKGDSFLLEWPRVGEINYTVLNSTIVEPTYEINTHENGNYLYLVTCDPIGSTEHRLIIQAEISDKNPINNEIIKNNPQELNAIIITGLFLVIGLIFSYFYPKNHRIYILATILIISAVLIYCCINPIPSQIIYDKIIFLNGGVWLDIDKKYFSNITSRERAIFEGAISMGALFHQFIGTPVSKNSKKGLEKTIEESLKLQPAIEKVEVKINFNRLEKNMNKFNYTSLSGDMLDVKIYTKVDNIKAKIRIEFIEELNYPLMYVEDIKD